MLKSSLFLHIGTQKTGTTTIQNTLDKNFLKLKKEGMIYLGRYRKLAGKIRTIEKIDHQLIDEFRTILDKDVRKFKEKNYRNFIISNEKFTGNKIKGYKNAPLIAESVKQITKDLNLDVYIIVYLRRQDDFFEATYSQRIFSGESLKFESFLNKFDESHFHWDELLNAYANVFGKDRIIVRRYDNHFLPHKDSLLNDFGSAIGSNFLASFDKTKNKNLGLTRDTLEILRLININFNKDERDQLRTTLKDLATKSPYEGYSFFGQRQRKEFLARYEESNKRVLKDYFNKDSGHLFPLPNFEVKTKDYPGLSTEKTAILLSEIILKQYHMLEEATDDNRKTEKSVTNKIKTKIKKLVS